MKNGNDDGALNMNRTVVWSPGRLQEKTHTVLKQRPATLWLTGLNSAGRSTIACALERHLLDCGHAAYVLDCDNVRHVLNRNLGFLPLTAQFR